MSSSQQQTFEDYGADLWTYTPLHLSRTDAASDRVAARELTKFGLAPEWVGKQPDEVDADYYHRYLFTRIFFYPYGSTYRDGERRPEDYFPVEFRTFIYTAGGEPSEELKRHIREVDNKRLRTLFNTGPYSGFMSGFQFVYHEQNVEDEEVAEDQANNLGIPQFEVEVKKKGSQQGYANGFFDPFAFYRRVQMGEVPKQEVWNLSFNSARNSYQASPQGRTSARNRAKNISGKEVHVNGHKVGTVTTDGRVWIKKEYQTSDQTYRGDWSREKLVQETGATYSAIRAGGNLYKVDEDADTIYLVTAHAKPTGFSPADPDEVPESGGVVRSERYEMDFDEQTKFLIRNDQGSMMGKYSVPLVRSIGKGTNFNTSPRMG